MHVIKSCQLLIFVIIEEADEDGSASASSTERQVDTPTTPAVERRSALPDPDITPTTKTSTAETPIPIKRKKKESKYNEMIHLLRQSEENEKTRQKEFLEQTKSLFEASSQAFFKGMADILAV